MTDTQQPVSSSATTGPKVLKAILKFIALSILWVLKAFLKVLKAIFKFLWVCTKAGLVIFGLCVDRRSTLRGLEIYTTSRNIKAINKLSKKVSK